MIHWRKKETCQTYVHSHNTKKMKNYNIITTLRVYGKWNKKIISYFIHFCIADFLN